MRCSRRQGRRCGCPALARHGDASPPRAASAAIAARASLVAAAAQLRPRRHLSPPPQAAPAQSSEPFGEEVTLEVEDDHLHARARNWDSAFETLVDSFKSVYGFLDQQGHQAGRAGDDDLHLDRRHRLRVPGRRTDRRRRRPIRRAATSTVGKSPAGKMLKFVHRGSYDAMDTTYEAITNYLDSKQLEAQDTVRRGIRHRSADHAGGQAGRQRIRAGEVGGPQLRA